MSAARCRRYSPPKAQNKKGYPSDSPFSIHLPIAPSTILHPKQAAAQTAYTTARWRHALALGSSCLSACSVDQVEYERRDHEDHADNRGQAREDLIRRGRLAGAEERFRAAGDRTQALLRAILEQYNDNQEQAGDNHYD